jgi:hypothetical protein
VDEFGGEERSTAETGATPTSVYTTDTSSIAAVSCIVSMREGVRRPHGLRPCSSINWNERNRDLCALEGGHVQAKCSRACHVELEATCITAINASKLQRWVSCEDACMSLHLFYQQSDPLSTTA